MIFITVGAQMPFDRMIRTVDEWAGSRGRSDIFAQIGASSYQPKYIRSAQFIDPIEFRKHVEAARIVVAHAGMGSIITALEFGKPIIVMPRRAVLRETRNDHQIATANHLAEQGRVILASDEQMLLEKLDRLESFCRREQIDAHASPKLIAVLRAFIEEATYSSGTDDSSPDATRAASDIRRGSAV